jgi:hypothetical protein
MLAVLTVSPQSLMDPSSRTLTRMAAAHELVLVCDYDAAPTLVRTVRTLLPRHRLVAILVDRDLLRHEHDLVEMILNDGNLPVVLTTGTPTAIQLSKWLNADTDRTISNPAADGGKTTALRRF